MRKVIEATGMIALMFFRTLGFTQTSGPSFISLQSDISAYSSQHTELLSSVSNPASLTAIKKFSVVLGSETRYLLNELNTFLFATALAVPSGYFGASVSYTGFASFHESVISFGYARQLAKGIDAGLQLKYEQFNQGGGYGSSHVPGFIAGSVWHINEKLSSGISVQHLLNINYEWGIGFDASEQFFVAVVVMKEEDQPVNVLCGFRYSPAKRIFFKAGVNTMISSPWFAAGVDIKKMRIEFFSAWHPVLGLSPGILIQFERS